MSTTDVPDILAPGPRPTTTVLNPTLVPSNVTGIERCFYVPTRLMDFTGSIVTPTLAAAVLGAFSLDSNLFGRERLRLGLYQNGEGGTAAQLVEVVRS